MCVCVYAHMSAHKKVSSSLFFYYFFSVDRYFHSAPAVVQERSQILSLASSADVYETRHLVYLFSNTRQKWI